MQFVSCTSDGTETDDLALVKTQLKMLEHQVTNLEQTIQQQRVDNYNLEHQVTRLEQTVHQQRVDNSNLEHQVTSLEKTVHQQRVDNINLESHVTGLESQVTCLESQVTGLEQTVQGLAVDNTILKNQLEIHNSKWTQSNIQMDLLQN